MMGLRKYAKFVCSKITLAYKYGPPSEQAVLHCAMLAPGPNKSWFDTNTSRWPSLGIILLTV